MVDVYQGGGVSVGSTNVSVLVLLRDASNNTVLSGKVAADVTAYYWRAGAAAPVAIAVTDMTNLDDVHTDGEWKQIHATQMKGLYRFDCPDAMWLTGANLVTLMITVAGAYVYPREFPLKNDARQTLNMGFGKREFVGDGVPGGSFGVYGYQVKIYEHDNAATLWKTFDVDHPTAPSIMVAV